MVIKCRTVEDKRDFDIERKPTANNRQSVEYLLDMEDH